MYKHPSMTKFRSMSAVIARIVITVALDKNKHMQASSKPQPEPRNLTALKPNWAATETVLKPNRLKQKLAIHEPPRNHWGDGEEYSNILKATTAITDTKH
jgi:hypothetical protein